MTNRRDNRAAGGFTLFELMVTVAVAAIILTAGVPGFLNIIQNNRATTHTNDLVAALNLARSEATRRATAVTVCSSTDGAACADDTDWTGGWVVRSSGGEVLRTWPARSGGDASVVSGNVSQIQFLARGSLGGGTIPVMQVRLPHCGQGQGRNVEVRAAGRISVARVDC